VAAFLVACRGPALALGDSPAKAREHIDELFSSMAAVFGPTTIEPRLDSIRLAFANAALSPSRLFADSAVWTAHAGSARKLDLAGAGTYGHYHLLVRKDAPTPSNLGDYRREVRLTELGKGEYEWDVRDELAIGAITAAELGQALGAVFSGAEHGDEGIARAAYRQQLPRTTAALAQLFSLDTLHLTPNGAGGTDVRLSIGIHPGRLQTDFQRYAKFLDKYVGPSDLRVVVYDDQKREWWSATKEHGRVTLSLRVRDGALAPLSGATARMPDRVHVRIDASTKAWIFRIGVRGLVGDVIRVRDPHESTTITVFRTQPEWQLPPLVHRMLNTPLRRPFEGGGSMLSFSVRDTPGAQTIGTRSYSLVVQESAIMRWFGGLGNSALGDFRKGAEQEFDRFNGLVLDALHKDLIALTAGSAASK
jgi:hypothetical protein